jgi:menaquinone-dependent protoporphyrinogen oxidase
MNKHILIGYATRTGSTVGVAEAFGETLGKRGFRVEVKPMKEVTSLEGYQAVILGSAINGAQWLPEAVDFVKSNQNALHTVPVALFCVHGMNVSDDEKAKKRRLAYLDNVRALIKPKTEAFFAGIGLDPGEKNKIIRWMYFAFGGGGEGDMRDWDKIRGWAADVDL